MKYLYSCLIIILSLYSCNQKVEEGSFGFDNKEIHSKFLSVELDLNGIHKTHELQALLMLSNIHNGDLTINDISIGTENGIWTSSEMGFQKFLLKKNKDTILSLRFTPINNPKLYKFTGKKGLFEQKYTFRIDFNDGSDEYDLNLENTLSNAQFKKYRDLNADTISVFSFDTKSGFAEEQKEYETKTEGFTEESNFINLSEQELAISGLNFRLHAFQRKDTLYGELAIVNHADFDVMADTSVICFKSLNQKPIKKLITIDKISGSQLKEEYNMLRKGDRLMIKIKQQTVLSDDLLELVLKDAFILKTGESLFYKNIRLVKDTIVI